MDMKKMIGWHFTLDDRLRDGRPVPPVGEWLEHVGDVVLCESGLHASNCLLDALAYAPGVTLHRVELGGEIIHDGDKTVASRRRILWTLDSDTVEHVLCLFAREVALSVIHLWDAPPIVREYLATGDESTRNAARAAAWDAAWAAGAGAGAAARAAAWAAAWAVAWDAAWDAAWAAGAAAGAGDGAAARDEQNRLLDSLVWAAAMEQGVIE